MGHWCANITGFVNDRLLSILFIDTVFCQIYNLHFFSSDDVHVRFVCNHVLRARTLRIFLYFSRCCMGRVNSSISSIDLLMGGIFLIPFVVYDFIYLRNVHLLMRLGNAWLRVIEGTSHGRLLLDKQSTFEVSLCIWAVLSRAREGIFGPQLYWALAYYTGGWLSSARVLCLFWNQFLLNATDALLCPCE